MTTGRRHKFDVHEDVIVVDKLHPKFDCIGEVCQLRTLSGDLAYSVSFDGDVYKCLEHQLEIA